MAPSQSEVAEEALANSYDDSTNSERAIVLHSINKYDWEELWRSLVAGCVQSCANAWSKILGTLHKASPHCCSQALTVSADTDAVVSCLSSILPLKVPPAPVELTPEQVGHKNYSS